MMTAIMVDSNVLLDLMTEDTRWLSCSVSALEKAADQSRLVINPIIYAEVSIRYSRIEDLEAALPKAVLDREAIPYLLYRRPCRGCRLPPVNPRSGALSQLFS
jgi:predicted nucleic acid-binding protein